MRIIISCIFSCLILVGCSDPEQSQGAPSPDAVYSIPKAEQGFEAPKQVASSSVFKIVSIASSEKPTVKVSSVNYQVRVK